MLDLNDSSKSRGSEERYLLAYVGRHGKCEWCNVMVYDTVLIQR